MWQPVFLIPASQLFVKTKQFSRPVGNNKHPFFLKNKISKFNKKYLNFIFFEPRKYIRRIASTVTEAAVYWHVALQTSFRFLYYQYKIHRCQEPSKADGLGHDRKKREQTQWDFLKFQKIMVSSSIKLKLCTTINSASYKLLKRRRTHLKIQWLLAHSDLLISQTVNILNSFF